MVRVAPSEPRSDEPARPPVAPSHPEPPAQEPWLAGLCAPVLAGGLGLSLAVLVAATCVVAIPLSPVTSTALALGVCAFGVARLRAIVLPPPRSLLIPSAARTASHVAALLGALALAGARADACVAAARLRPLEAVAGALVAALLTAALSAHHRWARGPMVSALLRVDATAGWLRWWAFALTPAVLVSALIGVDHIAGEPIWGASRWADRFLAASPERRAALLRELPRGEREGAHAEAVATQLRESTRVGDEALDALVPAGPDQVDRDATRFEEAVAARFFTPAWPSEERTASLGSSPPAEAARVGRIFDAIFSIAARPQVRRWARVHRRCDASPGETPGQAVAWFDAVACTERRGDALTRYARWTERWQRRDADGRPAGRGAVRACPIESALRGRGASRVLLGALNEAETDAATFGALAARELGARCEAGVAGRLLHLWQPGEPGRAARWQGAIGRSRRDGLPRNRSLELVESWRRGDRSGAEEGEVVSNIAGCAVPQGLRVMHQPPRILTREDCRD